MVISTFEEAIARHGKPEYVMNDGGSAFWAWRGISRFTSLLTELGIDQIHAEKKEHNGKVEVFNANLHKELFDRHRFYDLAEMKRRLAAHLHWYNHARTHHALGGLLVPADRYYGRAQEVIRTGSAWALVASSIERDRPGRLRRGPHRAGPGVDRRGDVLGFDLGRIAYPADRVRRRLRPAPLLDMRELVRAHASRRHRVGERDGAPNPNARASNGERAARSPTCAWTPANDVPNRCSISSR